MIIQYLFGGFFLFALMLAELFAFAGYGYAQPLAPGITQAIEFTKLSMTVGGRVEGIKVREGTRVKKNDLLLYLDCAKERLDVKRNKLIVADNVRLQALQERQNTLEKQVAAVEKLLESEAVSRKVAEDETLALQAVIAEKNALVMAKKLEKVELELARNAYDKCHMRSPIDGIVSRVMIHIGESIAPNEPVIEVVNVSRVRFIGTFPESGEQQLRKGQKIKIKVGLHDTAFVRDALVVFVSPVTDSASGLVEFIAEFENADASVRPGVAGQVVLP